MVIIILLLGQVGYRTLAVRSEWLFLFAVRSTWLFLIIETTSWLSKIKSDSTASGGLKLCCRFAYLRKSSLLQNL